MLTYTYRYNRVIQWFRDHPITKESHPDSEVHHIVPQSCGGEDIKENKVLLPTRWHYIIHCWLPAVYLEQGNQEYYEKMLFAWNRMQNYREDFRSGLQTIKEDSWLYQKLRDEYSKAVGKLTTVTQKGNKNSQYGKHWWKDPNDKTKSLSIKDGDPVPEGWIRGRWATEEQCEKNRINSSKRKWYFNPTTKESKHAKLSLDEENILLSQGWVKGHRDSDFSSHFSIRTYTSDGINRLKIKDGEEIPEGYVLLYFWSKSHPKKLKTLEELKEIQRKANAAAVIVTKEKNKKWVAENIDHWREMYLWYLENGEDFEAMCSKFAYTKGRTNFLYLIKKYIPEIYKATYTKEQMERRPKHRGKYKKRAK